MPYKKKAKGAEIKISKNRENLILDLVRRHHNVHFRDLKRLVSKGTNKMAGKTLERLLAKMVSEGKLVRTPKGNKVQYSIFNPTETYSSGKDIIAYLDSLENIIVRLQWKYPHMSFGEKVTVSSSLVKQVSMNIIGFELYAKFKPAHSIQEFPRMQKRLRMLSDDLVDLIKNDADSEIICSLILSQMMNINREQNSQILGTIS